jgi:RNA polymerase sigma-70 factor, ECF subfamily
MTLYALVPCEAPPLEVAALSCREPPAGACARAPAGMLAVGTPRVPPLDSASHQRALAEAASRGDRRAAEALIALLLPRVRNLVRYLLRGDADVDDLAQEALVTILRGLPGYRGEGTVTAWSDRIVARSVFAHLRRTRASDKVHVEYTPDLVPVPSGESAHGFLSRRRLVRALDELPEEQRMVLVMHHALGLSVREIADEIAVPFETVRSRLRLGMARLRSVVAEDGEPEARSS